MKSKSYKIISTAGSIFILLAVLLSTNSCESNNPEDIQAVVNEGNLPSLSLNDLETVITDSGKVSYRFLTAEMNQYDNRQEPFTEFPEGLHLIVYNNQGEIEAQVKSQYAIYYEDEDLWELQNNVEAVNYEDEVINTEKLYWDSKTDRIYSDEFIKITTHEEILTGYGFESDEKFENYTIKNISGILAIEEEQKK